MEGAVKPDTDQEGEGSEDGSKTKDFQAQFLEFSQRRQHQMEAGSGGQATAQTAGDGDKGVIPDGKAGVSHIAALLQVPVCVRGMVSVCVCVRVSAQKVGEGN